MYKVFIGHAHLQQLSSQGHKTERGNICTVEHTDVEYKSTKQTENTLISFKTTFIINFRHEKVDNKTCILGNSDNSLFYK